MCKQGNVGAAISFVAMAISFSIHIAQAVYTSFELANFFVVVLIGGALQLGMRPVLRRLIIWDSQTTDQAARDHNWGFAFVVGSLQIYFARILSSMVYESCADFVYNPDYYCTTRGWDCADDFVRADNLTESEVFIHASCYSDEDVCISVAVKSLYTASGWVAVETGSSCMLSANMTLGDRLLATDFAWEFFAWSHVWQVLTTLLFLFLAKFFYAAPYLLAAAFSGDGETMNLSTALTDPKKQAVCLSFAGYIFGYCSVVESQFRNLRLSDLSKVFEDGSDTHRLEEFLGDMGWVLVGMGMMIVRSALDLPHK